MNQLATRTENLPTSAQDQESNPFTEHAQQSGLSSIVGKLLKFSKGDWEAGGQEIDKGTEFIVNMDSLIHGWVKWQEQKPVEQLMGLVIDRFKVPQRKTLGDDDESAWELLGGKPIDPWAETFQVVFKSPTDGQLYTFASSSWGGRKAFIKLCADYGRELRTKGSEWPVIRIGTNNRDSDEYGKIKEPTLEIARWVPKSEFEPVQAEMALDDERLPETRF